MNRQHFESKAAWVEALTKWQEESWARQGKPEGWAMRVTRSQLDTVAMVLNVDVLACSELFLASLPAAAVLERNEVH